ncbi:hypothetical protein KKC16_01280, partial [Patescibacteria group bacterium]|nr:hypothetical protein [Patescibacteria group bacterium]
MSLCALVGFLTVSSINITGAEEIVAKYAAKKFNKNVAKITYSLSINKNTRIERFDVTTKYKDSLTQTTRDTTDNYLRIVENNQNKYFANKQEINIPEGYINPFQLSDMLDNFKDTTSTKKHFKIRVDGNKEIGVSCEYHGEDSIKIGEGPKHHVNIYKIKLDEPFKW